MNLKKRGASTQAAICLAFIALLGVEARAQETTRLNQEKAVELALKNNLSLESSRANLAMMERASMYSWNQFIPNVTLAGTISRDNKASKASGLAPVDLSNLFPMLPPDQIYGVVPYSVDISRWNLIGSVQASLNINFAMFENMKRLRLDYDRGVINYEKAKAQLERDVRKAYHGILLLRENVSLLRGSFANVERQVQIAQANYNAGLAPELTLLQARVAMENMRPSIEQAEDGLKLLMSQFAMYLGLDYNTSFELDPVTESANFIPVDIEEMIKKSAREKPDIKELRQTILMMESARKAQVYALTPTLSLSWNNNSILNGFKGDWINAGSLTLSLGVRLHSLIPFSVDTQGIKNLEDQIKTANIGLAQMINGTEIEIYNIVLSLERSLLSARAQAQTTALAEQSYRLTEQAYQAGLQDYFQVQNAELSLRQARVQTLEQQFNYLNSLIDLEYSIGVPFGTLSKRSN